MTETSQEDLALAALRGETDDPVALKALEREQARLRDEWRERVWQDEPLISFDAERTATYTPWRVLSATAAPVGWWAVRVQPEQIKGGWHYQSFWAEPIAAWAVIELAGSADAVVQQMVPMIDDGDGRLHPASASAVICQGEDPEAAYNAAQLDGSNEWTTSRSCGSRCAACSEGALDAVT